jgi:hypothetical protein
VRESLRAELVAALERLEDRGCDRLGDLRVGAYGRVAAGVVERRMRRCDDRRARRHRLGHRHAEALESRRVDDRCCAAVEAGELVVGDAAEPDDAGAVELRLLAPAGATGDGERKPTVGNERVGVDERGEVLARLEGRDREQVRLPEVLGVAVGSELLADARVCDDDPVPREAERLRDVVGGEGRVREDDVARARGVLVLARVHRARARSDPLRKVERHEVVDRRRAEPSALRRVHPVREVQHVEGSEPALCRRVAEPRPRGAPAVRAEERPQAQLHRDAVQRLRDHAPALRRRRRERDHLVAVARCRLGEAGERASDVVVDARPLVGQRRHVERDPHGP